MNIPMIPKNLPIRETEQSREVSQNKSMSRENMKDTVSIGEESKVVSRLLSQLKELQNTKRPDNNK